MLLSQCSLLIHVSFAIFQPPCHFMEPHDQLREHGLCNWTWSTSFQDKGVYNPTCPSLLLISSCWSQGLWVPDGVVMKWRRAVWVLYSSEQEIKLCWVKLVDSQELLCYYHTLKPIPNHITTILGWYLELCFLVLGNLISSHELTLMTLIVENY